MQRQGLVGEGGGLLFGGALRRGQANQRRSTAARISLIFISVIGAIVLPSPQKLPP